MLAERDNWSAHVNDIIRSRHYTWIGAGLGGRDVPEAMTRIMADVLHICRSEGILIDDLLSEGQRLAATEESTEARKSENEPASFAP